MKHLRPYLASAFILLPVAGSLATLSTGVAAQAMALEVQSLNVEADAGLEPGSRLRMRLAGTPRAQASVRIQGVRETIPLREVQPGVYVGRYTLKRTDRVRPNSDVTATARIGKRSVTAAFDLDETMAPPVVQAPPPPPPPPPRPPEPRIERFGMLPIERIEPGAELVFAVEGMPGANVSVDLPGIRGDVGLRETRPGHYEGSYTLRRNDDLNPTRPLVATLRQGDRTVTSSINIAIGRPGPGGPPPGGRPPGGDNRAPFVVQLVPAEGAVVPAGPPVLVQATFEDRGGSGVDPASVRIVVSGRNVTPEAQITRQSVSFRAPLPPGRHTVEVSARDQAGNQVSKSWSFDVAAAPPVNVPLRFISHGMNQQVGGGTTTVQAQTNPGASVAVTVVAAAPFGGPINVQQQLLNQTVQADPNGNFQFSFNPQFPIPGTRYEITVISTRGNLRSEGRLTLVQR